MAKQIKVGDEFKIMVPGTWNSLNVVVLKVTKDFVTVEVKELLDVRKYTRRDFELIVEEMLTQEK